MKRLLYYLLFAVILSACNAKGNHAGSSTETDSTGIIQDSAKKEHQVRAIPPVIINYTHSRQKTEPIDTCNVRFDSDSYRHVYEDTVIDGIAVKYICTETLDPEDYIFSDVVHRETNVYGDTVDVPLIMYGVKASIMWEKTTRNGSRKDTLLITRDLIAESLSKMGFFDKNDTKLFGLSDLRFKEVRNDSMVFNLKFGWPATDYLYELELKFDKDSLGKSFTIKDIYDIWMFGDDD